MSIHINHPLQPLDHKISTVSSVSNWQALLQAVVTAITLACSLIFNMSKPICENTIWYKMETDKMMEYLWDNTASEGDGGNFKDYTYQAAPHIEANEPDRHHYSFIHHQLSFLSAIVKSSSTHCLLHLSFISLSWHGCHITNHCMCLHADTYNAPHQRSLIFAIAFTITFMTTFSLIHWQSHWGLQQSLTCTHTHTSVFQVLPHGFSHALVCTTLTLSLTHFRIHTPTFVPWLTTFTCTHQNTSGAHAKCWCCHHHPIASMSRFKFMWLKSQGTWFGPLLLMLDSASVILVVSFISFYCCFHLSRFITYCGSCHATSGPLGCRVLVQCWKYWVTWTFISHGSYHMGGHIISRQYCLISHQ